MYYLHINKYVLRQSFQIEMSSDSDQHSSSSVRSPKRKEDERSRSRSRDKQNTKSRNYDRNADFRERKVKVKVPDLSGQLLSFKYFLNLQTDKISSSQIEKAYERYKKDWEQFQNELFLKEGDPWFAEKYHPEVIEALERERKQNVKKNCEEFNAKLLEGLYDKVDFRIKQASSLGSIAQNERNEEEEETSTNLISNQVIEVHTNPNNDITREPYFGFDPDSCTLFIKQVPRTISRAQILETVNKLEGFKNLTMSDPVKKMNLTKYCWIEFENQVTCAKAELAMSGLIIKNESLAITKSISKAKRVKILKNYPKSRLEIDLQTVIKLAKTLDAECGIQNSSIYAKPFSNIHTKFDTFLLYLRKVHAYDYFTASGFENERILALKIGSAFLRIEADYEQVHGFQTVFKKIQQNAQRRIEKGPQTVDQSVLLREQIQKFIRASQKLGKDQQKEIWKCLYCDKKFKTCQFLAKHMISKHEQIKIDKIQVVMAQSYIRDPQKITYSHLRDDKDYFKGGRKPFNSSYRGSQRKRQNYKDFDEPEGGEKVQKVIGKPMVNFLDI